MPAPADAWFSAGGDGSEGSLMHTRISETAPLSLSAKVSPSASSISTAERFVRPINAFLSGFAFFLLMLTLTPFPRIYESEAVDEGNIINQLGYIGLGSLYLSVMIMTVDRRILKSLLSPTWFIVFGIAYISCLQSYDPVTSARGVTQSLVVMILVAGVLVLPRTERDFVNAGANAILTLLIIVYAMIMLAPERAIHTGVGFETWHAGNWKGHLIHKNVAAPVYSVLCMFGIYCLRSGAPRRGWAIALLAANFVLHTGSKTTTGFLPLAVLIVLAGAMLGRRRWMIAAHFAFTIIILCLTLGTIYSDTFLSITSSLLGDPSYTGRDDIWKFASASIKDHVMLGYGYFSFWLSPVIRGLEADFEANWDVRGIVTGHNTYLDAVVMFGVPGGLTIIALLMVKPFRDYMRAVQHPSSRLFADFCIMVVIFMTYNGMMESFFLNRADPMWMQLALAVFGLNIASKRSLI